MTRREFEQVVEEAVASLPEELRRRIENVEFRVVESRSRRQSKRRQPPQEGELYGLFEGPSFADKGPGYGEAGGSHLPSRITIYKHTIERDFPERGEMIRCIQETVLHEIGHYFGMDEDQLDAYGIG